MNSITSYIKRETKIHVLSRAAIICSCFFFQQLSHHKNMLPCGITHAKGAGPIQAQKWKFSPPRKIHFPTSLQQSVHDRGIIIIPCWKAYLVTGHLKIMERGWLRNNARSMIFGTIFIIFVWYSFTELEEPSKSKR